MRRLFQRTDHPLACWAAHPSRTRGRWLRIGGWIAYALAALALQAPAYAQSVPDVGASGTVSSIQSTACVPAGPVNNKFNHCGWGVWTLSTQRQTVIAALATPTSYLLCRNSAATSEPIGTPVVYEVDGSVVSGGTPPSPMEHASGGCLVLTGKKIVVAAATKPKAPVRGFFIRLGPLAFGNTVAWNALKAPSGASNVLPLSQVLTPRPMRVCFGEYLPIDGQPRPLDEYKLWLDGSYAMVRGSEQAIFAANSCVDVDSKTVGVDPVWGATAFTTGNGYLSF